MPAPVDGAQCVLIHQVLLVKVQGQHLDGEGAGVDHLKLRLVRHLAFKEGQDGPAVHKRWLEQNLTCSGKAGGG